MFGSESTEWQVVGKADELPNGAKRTVRLLGCDLTIARQPDGHLDAMCDSFTPSACERYGLLWICLGSPALDVPDYPEFYDPQYQTTVCGPYGVATSAPRVIENFLDMAHFPYVHAGILGQEPNTDIPDYDVKARTNGLGPTASNCVVWQPQPSVGANGGGTVTYTYEVARPYCAILRRALAPPAPGFALLLAVHPIEAKRSVGWMLYTFAAKSRSDAEQRARENVVFLQDKPILENQLPRELPLDPLAEVSLRCDRLSIAYRRYLRERNVRFGALWPGAGAPA